MDPITNLREQLSLARSIQACAIDGGTFKKGDLIRWSRKKGDKGITYHDRCHPDNRDGKWDARNAEAATSRGQGPMFDAVDEAESNPVVTPPSLSRSGHVAMEDVCI